MVIFFPILYVHFLSLSFVSHLSIFCLCFLYFASCYFVFCLFRSGSAISLPAGRNRSMTPAPKTGSSELVHCSFVRVFGCRCRIRSKYTRAEQESSAKRLEYFCADDTHIKTSMHAGLRAYKEEPLGALRPPPLVRREPGVLRPGFVGMRRPWSSDCGMQYH